MSWSCNQHEIDSTSPNWVEEAKIVAELLGNREFTPCPYCVHHLIRKVEILENGDAENAQALINLHEILDGAGVKGHTLAERVEFLTKLVAVVAPLIHEWDTPRLPLDQMEKLSKRMEDVKDAYYLASTE